MQEHNLSFQDIYESQKVADIALREYWLYNNLFSFKWWIIVALAFIPWLLWLKVVDRKKLFEIMTYGLFVMTIAFLFDAIGVEFDLWDYKYRLIPLLDVFIVYDFAVIPVVYMIIYQYFYTWKSFIIAHIVLSLIFSFIAEPLLILMDVYQIFKWKYAYSLPIYFSMAISLKWIVIKLIDFSKKEEIV